MKKLDKHAFSEKALKIKENIKMPRMKSTRRKASDGDGSRKDIMEAEEYQAEEPQEEMRYTGTALENMYRIEHARRNLYQTGTVSENTYQAGTVSRSTYRRGTSQRNLYQAGAVSGSTYQSGVSQRNVYQAGTISGDVNQGETSWTRRPQKSLRQPETSRNQVRQTGTVRQNNAMQNNAAQGGIQRKRRQIKDARLGSLAGERVKAAPGTKLSGTAAVYIKIALAAVLLLFIVFDLSDEPNSAARIETVAENVVKAAGLQSLEPAEARMVKRFYGLNPNDYEGAVLYAPEDNMDAHELFLIKLKDDTQKKTVEDAIEERLDTQLKSFEGYGAQQTALLEKHVLSVKGNYVLYVVGEYAEDAQKAFAKSL